MERAVAELTAEELDSTLLEDEYAAKLLELAEQKRDAGKDVVEIEEAPPEDEETSAEIIDIMACSSSGWAPQAVRARGTGSRGAARAGGASAASGDDAFADKSKKELYEQAKKLDLPGRSSMSREELIAALRKAG